MAAGQLFGVGPRSLGPAAKPVWRVSCRAHRLRSSDALETSSVLQGSTYSARSRSGRRRSCAKNCVTASPCAGLRPSATPMDLSLVRKTSSGSGSLPMKDLLRTRATTSPLLPRKIVMSGRVMDLGPHRELLIAPITQLTTAFLLRAEPDSPSWATGNVTAGHRVVVIRRDSRSAMRTNALYSMSVRARGRLHGVTLVMLWQRAAVAACGRSQVFVAAGSVSGPHSAPVPGRPLLARRPRVGRDRGHHAGVRAAAEAEVAAEDAEAGAGPGPNPNAGEPLNCGSITVKAAQNRLYGDGHDGRSSRVRLFEHELCHLVGLDHVRDRYSVMYPTVLDVSGVSRGDRIGFRRLGSTCASKPGAPEDARQRRAPSVSASHCLGGCDGPSPPGFVKQVIRARSSPCP